MNSILVSNGIEETDGFWGRQFRATQTPRRMVFDVIFGILMPLLCFYFDPGIIRGDFLSPLPHLILFIYGFSGIAILTLSLWLVLGDQLRSASAIVGGVLVAGAVCSFSIGVMILPLTLAGMFVVIGALGLVPFVTGFVYLRQAIRAFTNDSTRVGRSPRVATLFLSALVALALPGLAQWKVNEIVGQSMTEILNEDSGSAALAVQRIKQFSWVVDMERMASEYERESNPSRRERIARAYKEITGDELESLLRPD